MVCFRGRSIVPRPYSVRVLLELPRAQSPFACLRCYLAPRGLDGPRQQVFPCLPRSYGLMRQSSTLPWPTDSPWTTGLCRLLSAPAGQRTFPTLSLRIFPYVLGPLPPAARVVRLPVSSHTTTAFPSFGPGRRSTMCRTATSLRRAFRGCSHSRMFRPIGLLATQIAPTDTAVPYGSRDFYVRASRGLLPSHAPVMLTVRVGQLTVWGLTPHQIRSLVGCSPNARAHLPPAAAATQERRLAAVRCSAWLGRRPSPDPLFARCGSLPAPLWHHCS